MNKGAHKRSFYFAIVTCPVGLAVGIYIRYSFIGDYSEFPYYSTLSAFLASYISWLFIVERSDIISINRGVLAGVISAMFAHYLCWYSSIVVANIQYWVFGIQIGSLPDPPIDPIFGLIAVLLYTFISYLFFGWFTIPTGAGLGWLFSRYFAKKNESLT